MTHMGKYWTADDYGLSRLMQMCESEYRVSKAPHLASRACHYRDIAAAFYWLKKQVIRQQELDVFCGYLPRKPYYEVQQELWAECLAHEALQSRLHRSLANHVMSYCNL